MGVVGLLRAFELKRSVVLCGCLRYLLIIFDPLNHPTFSSEKRTDEGTVNTSSNQFNNQEGTNNQQEILHCIL